MFNVEFIRVIDESTKNTNNLRQRFKLRPFRLNPYHVIRAEPAPKYRGHLREGMFFEDEKMKLDHNHEFTSLIIVEGQHATTITVVGSLAEISKKLDKALGPKLLKG